MSKIALIAIGGNSLITDKAHADVPHQWDAVRETCKHLADMVEGEAIDYRDLPGFPHAQVSGHNPKLVIGRLGGCDVAILGGREHYYEHGLSDELLERIKAANLQHHQGY